MREFESKASSTAAQKSKIRERYKGVNADELDVIPALPQEDFYEDVKTKRVAVYARVFSLHLRFLDMIKMKTVTW